MGVEKKLTGEEILKRLDEVFGNDVSAYAHGDYTEADIEEIEGFEYDEVEAERVGKIRDNYYQSVKENLPDNYQDRKVHPDFIKWQSMPSKYQEMERQLLDFLGLGKIVEVAQQGGMDEGSNWYSVKHFVDHDVYIRTNGWYQSHDGTYFEDGIGEVVTPKSKVITVYES